MATIGHITKTGGSSLTFSSDIGTSSREGGAAYSLRRHSGQHIGTFATVGSAKKAFERVVGGHIIWVRADLNGNVEHWRATQ